MTLQPKLSDLLSNIEEHEENGKIIVRADYNPTLAHSEHFVRATKDTNPIHIRHEKHGNAIVPGWLNTAVGTGLLRITTDKANVDHESYPFFHIESSFDQATNFDSQLVEIFDFSFGYKPKKLGLRNSKLNFFKLSYTLNFYKLTLNLHYLTL